MCLKSSFFLSPSLPCSLPKCVLCHLYLMTGKYKSNNPNIAAKRNRGKNVLKLRLQMKWFRLSSGVWILSFFPALLYFFLNPASHCKMQLENGAELLVEYHLGAYSRRLLQSIVKLTFRILPLFFGYWPEISVSHHVSLFVR